ncbi:BZ3500_MvSof-1268-A1-R1_Chr8-2g10217 [Microbotryum saponariae]|uniref:BZ3500_MvSof-1268-A1-R1_Chr8-2g10217 protein n=1 Tax=Microbotryum saponariae TaxID=289078 RepID=A0A2X0LZC5_9BASI|nr:BZ3500_MvSof-1268-A1-R1_Chr8-2g10217 [Microbotryum saponariae]SDA02015.1 BZ3501_MvSof-1269-A2-R1_Chr8-2g09967 [Microbotryum saponariae]
MHIRNRMLSGLAPIFADGHYTGRIARGVVHEHDKNFFLSTIDHLSYDTVDLLAPIPILAQEADEFINDNQNYNGQDGSRPAPGRRRPATKEHNCGAKGQSEDDLARGSRGRIAGQRSRPFRSRTSRRRVFLWR